MDLAPTLLAAAGIDVPQMMQGRSLLPICTGEADPAVHRDYVYCEYYNAWTHHRSYGTMMRTRDKKIAVYHGVDEGELYDLATDPDEFDNLWAQSPSGRSAARPAQTSLRRQRLHDGPLAAAAGSVLKSCNPYNR